MFGNIGREPLKLLKEKLLYSKTESINLLQYVSDFRTKFFRTCEVAKTNLRGVVSKETVVLRRLESIAGNLVLKDWRELKD